MFKKILSFILFVVLLTTIVSVQNSYDRSAKGFLFEQKQKAVSFSEPLVPSVSVLNFLSLGDKPLVADLLWLDTIQYFGTGNPYGKYKGLGPMLDSITQLDPRYEEPYSFGLVVLPFMDQIPMAITLGERAQRALPGNGLLTYYHASNHLLYTKDYKQAAYYYDLASKEKDAPTSAKTLAATSLVKASGGNINDRLIARDYWQTIADQAKNDKDKELALNWRDQLQMVYDLENIALKFKTDTGAFPKSFQELVSKGYLKELPKSPVQRILELDPNTGKVSFERLAPES